VCGRFTLTLTTAELAAAFGIDVDPGAELPRYNFAPTQLIPVITAGRPSAAEWLRWGLVPHWARDPDVGNRLINARGETLADKSSFREAFQRRRCLVLADGFYEWKQEGQSKQPWYVRQRSGRPFTMAGLWEAWRAPEGGTLRTATIVTTLPNGLVGQLHDRMPVIVPPEGRRSWLDPGEGGRAAVEALLRPSPAEELEAYPVSPKVASAAVDEPDCIVPVGDRLRAGGRVRPLQPGLWEGDDLADGVGANEEHDQPVHAKGGTGGTRH